MASANVLEVTDHNFQEKVLDSSVPVLLDFGAEWCGPCKAIAPYMDELADEYNGKALVGKIDLDESPMTAHKLGVRSIPTVVVFKDGKELARKVGAGPKSLYSDMLKKAL